MPRISNRSPECAKVIEVAGGVVALATKLGLSQPAVSQWAKVPAEHVGRVARITGLAPHEIRPDLFEAKAA